MKTLFITTALALFAAPALAETKWQWGCEWQQPDNGNYFFKVDGGCRHFVAMGHSNMADYNGDTKVRPDFGDDEDEDDGGEGPGDGGNGGGEGPGDDGGNGAGPDDNGGGNEGPGTEEPSKPGKDRPGKPGKGKGRR